MDQFLNSTISECLFESTLIFKVEVIDSIALNLLEFARRGRCEWIPPILLPTGRNITVKPLIGMNLAFQKLEGNHKGLGQILLTTHINWVLRWIEETFLLSTTNH